MCNVDGKHKGHRLLSLEESKGFVTETLRKSLETIESDEPTLRDIKSELTKDADEYQKKGRRSEGVGPPAI